MKKKLAYLISVRDEKARVEKRKADIFLVKMVLFSIPRAFLKVQLILLFCAVNIRQRKGTKANLFPKI